MTSPLQAAADTPPAAALRVVVVGQRRMEPNRSDPNEPARGAAESRERSKPLKQLRSDRRGFEILRWSINCRRLLIALASKPVIQREKVLGAVSRGEALEGSFWHGELK